MEHEVDAAFGVLWDHLVVEDEPTACDAAICFGSRHWRVPGRAADLVIAGLAPAVVVTGGTLEVDGRREADRIAAELVTRGVPVAAICIERSARNTSENVALGVAALRLHLSGLGRSGPTRRLALVSWPLAARRCRATLARHHPGVEPISVPALPAAGRRWAPTPKRIGLALGELDRLERYGLLGHIEPVPCPDEVRDAARELRRDLLEAGDPAPRPRERRDVSATGPPVQRSAEHPTSGPVVPADAVIEPEEAPLLLRER